MLQHRTELVTHNQTISVVVDDREPLDHVLSALDSFGKFSAEVRRLPVGDYLVDDVLLVERKTISDIVQSIIDGRLFTQALRLSESSYVSIIVVEGTSEELADTRMRWEAVQGALITVTLFFGIPVLFSHDINGTLRTMLYASQQQRRVSLNVLSRRSRRPKKKANLQRYILQGLPGIGPKRARQLIDRFKSVQAVVGANAEELASVEGISIDTARKIRDAVE